MAWIQSRYEHGYNDAKGMHLVFKATATELADCHADLQSVGEYEVGFRDFVEELRIAESDHAVAPPPLAQ